MLLLIVFIALPLILLAHARIFDTYGNKRFSSLPMADDSSTNRRIRYLFAKRVNNEIDEETLIPLKNIFGIDNRVAVESSAYPWSAVGKLSTGCTGTLVGSDLVLTAAHCVIDSKTHALSTKSLYFYANMIDGKSSHQAFVSHIWWGTTDPNTNRNKDWALLRLDKKLGDTQGWLGVRMLSTNTMITTSGTLVGYSADFRNSKTAGVHIGCSITKQLKDDLFIHNCDMTRGASGGPIFANWNGSPYIYALNVAEFRHGGDQSLQIWDFNDNEANVAMWSVELMNKINSLKQS